MGKSIGQIGTTTASRVRFRRAIPRAAAAVECAIVLPFLLLATTAAVDFARVYHATQVLEQSATAGASSASGGARTTSDTSCDDAAKCAACSAGVALPVDRANVSVDSTATTASVTVSANFVPITPIGGLVGPLTLSRTV